MQLRAPAHAALALAGCVADGPTRDLSTAMPTHPTEARAPATVRGGTWTPAPGRIVALAATDDALFAAEVPPAGDPIRVHVGRWRDGAFRWGAPWAVPRPSTVPADHDLAGTDAWLGVVATPRGVDVTLSRVEYQGGSHGVALATWNDPRWLARGDIPSPTDADIAFGAPALWRDPHLLTAADHLWQYTRTGTRWQTRALDHPAGRFDVIPLIAADADTHTFVVAHEPTRAPHLAVYRPDGAGALTLAAAHALPAPIEALVMHAGELHVGCQRPLPDGALVWTLPPDRAAPIRRHLHPDPRAPVLTALDVNTRAVLLLHPDAAWILPTTPAAPPSRLELPARRRSSRPIGVLMGDHAVLLLDDRLGVYPLDGSTTAAIEPAPPP